VCCRRFACHSSAMSTATTPAPHRALSSAFAQRRKYRTRVGILQAWRDCHCQQVGPLSLILKHGFRIIRLCDRKALAAHPMPTPDQLDAFGRAPPVSRNRATAALNVPCGNVQLTMYFIEASKVLRQEVSLHACGRRATPNPWPTEGKGTLRANLPKWNPQAPASIADGIPSGGSAAHERASIQCLWPAHCDPRKPGLTGCLCARL
jgi:hypothetical protein